MKRQRRNGRHGVVRSAALTLLAAGAMVFGAVQPAHAEDTGDTNSMTTEVTAGPRTASINDGDELEFDSVTTSYSYSESSYAEGTLRVTDNSGTAAGWTVSAISSDLAYGGDKPGGIAIPATRVYARAQGAPDSVDGMSVNGTGGPKTFSGAVALGSEQILLGADANYGMGEYTLDLEFEIRVPPYSRVGNYSGTLTITIAPNVPPV